MNRVVLVGRLTKDPELRKVGTGSSVTSFTLAVDRRFKSPGKPDADFIPCTAWGKTAETICAYLHKGRQIAVDGRIQVNSYDDQNGQRQYRTDVVVENFDFLGSKNDNQGYSQNQGYAPNQGYGQDQYSNYGNNGGYQSGGYGQSQGYPQQRSTYKPAANDTAPAGNPYASPINNSTADSFTDGLEISDDDLPF